jgi:hypothetical protein
VPDDSGQTPAEDDIDRQLRELTEGRAGAARYRELSAAERAKTAKKQSKQARKQRKQTKARARETRRQARRMVRRSTVRRRAATATSWTVAIAILGGTVWFGYQHVRHGGSTVAGSAVSAINNPPAVKGAVSPPAATGPGADPFAGTPADHWANGAAGIIIPAAAPHGRFTASEVAAAYATARKLLIAQNLDPTTLRGGAPTAFEDLLQKEQRQDFIANLAKTGAAKDGSELSSRGEVASFAPGTTTLIGKVIKVYGTMSAQEATDQGSRVLDINVNYRFVYPVEPPRDPAAWMRVVGQVSGVIEFNTFSDPGGALLPWVTSAYPSEAGKRCDVHDGFIHPEYTVDAPDKVKPSGTPIDPYSLKIPKFNGACAMTTGT